MCVYHAVGFNQRSISAEFISGCEMLAAHRLVVVWTLPQSAMRQFYANTKRLFGSTGCINPHWPWLLIGVHSYLLLKGAANPIRLAKEVTNPIRRASVFVFRGVTSEQAVFCSSYLESQFTPDKVRTLLSAASQRLFQLQPRSIMRCLDLKSSSRIWSDVIKITQIHQRLQRFHMRKEAGRRKRPKAGCAWRRIDSRGLRWDCCMSAPTSC